MFELCRRIGGMKIWEYSHDVSPAALLRHYCRAERVMATGIGSNVLMLSSMLECLLAEAGWWRNAWFVVLLVSTPVAVVMIVPTIIAGAWAGETARECQRRGVSGVDVSELERLAPTLALKAMAYAAAIVFAANICGRNPAWRPYAGAAAAGLTVISLFRILRARRKASQMPETTE